MITAEDVELVVERCRTVPLSKNRYVADDFVTCLVETVVDFQQHTTTVERAMRYFVSQRRPDLNTMDDLKERFAWHPDTRAGNTALAQALWGYKFWTRAHMLRELVAFFDEQGVGNLESLRAWAAVSDFKRDFEGRVKGLGPTVYNWLVMRLGVETVKPDVHLQRFVSATLGRSVPESDVVAVVSAAAKQLGMRAYELDWGIWEYQRTG